MVGPITRQKVPTAELVMGRLLAHLPKLLHFLSCHPDLAQWEKGPPVAEHQAEVEAPPILPVLMFLLAAKLVVNWHCHLIEVDQGKARSGKPLITMRVHVAADGLESDSTVFVQVIGPYMYMSLYYNGNKSNRVWRHQALISRCERPI